MRDFVLIVEDEAALRDALRYYLEHKGMRVVVAADGEQAIALFDREKPAVVLLDLLMPKVDGLQVLRHVRERDTSLPVIINTNLSKGYEPKKWAELGATEVVVKSEISLKALTEKIRGYLPA